MLLRWGSWLLLGALSLAAVIVTPFLLRLTAPRGMNWAELSDISQTYAAIAAPLTAAALLGAVASLTYQARQARVSHEETRNSTHRALLSLALDDRELRVCWGPARERLTPVRWRQFTYTNMILSFWHSEFTLARGAAADAVLKANASRLFQGEIGREYWTMWAAGWRVTMSHGRRSRRFIRILDQAFDQAQAAGPAVLTSDYFLPEQP
ncbi:DUF6082 family protein [Streptomyces sp. NPDC002324]